VSLVIVTPSFTPLPEHSSSSYTYTHEATSYIPFRHSSLTFHSHIPVLHSSRQRWAHSGEIGGAGALRYFRLFQLAGCAPIFELAPLSGFSIALRSAERKIGAHLPTFASHTLQS
jgi:hypothetical protein